MREDLENSFLKHLNENIGIIHKVCRIYFPHDQDDRDDAVQETMYQLWKSYPSFNGESKFSTWMYRVALNTVITRVRKKIRAPDKERLPPRYDQVADHSDSEQQEERLASLYQAIQSLSDVDKAIILLYLEDNSYEEIASVTGLTKSHVGVRLVRAKRILEERLKNIL